MLCTTLSLCWGCHVDKTIFSSFEFIFTDFFFFMRLRQGLHDLTEQGRLFCAQIHFGFLVLDEMGGLHTEAL